MKSFCDNESLLNRENRGKLKLKVKRKKSVSSENVDINHCQPLRTITNVLSGETVDSKKARKNPFAASGKDTDKESLPGVNKGKRKFNVMCPETLPGGYTLNKRRMSTSSSENRDDHVEEAGSDCLKTTIESLEQLGASPPYYCLASKKAVAANRESYKYNVHNIDIKEISSDQANMEKFPLDWSLKTKLKFTSPKPFSWALKLSSSEESEGRTNFVRCYNNSTGFSLATHSYSAEKIRLQKCLMTWIHPNIPWIPTFPLLSTKEVHATEALPLQKDSVVSNKQVQSLIMLSWTQSFRSLFTLTKTGYCPYFYICSEQCMCLFRAENIGFKDISAILTPTTKGFREMMKHEGNMNFQTCSNFKKCLIPLIVFVPLFHLSGQDTILWMNFFMNFLGCTSFYCPCFEQKDKTKATPFVSHDRPLKRASHAEKYIASMFVKGNTI